MSNNINTITLEVNAAADLVDRDTFATVFCIHNRYVGQDEATKKPLEKAVPIGVLFSGPTLNYAKKVVTKGSGFVVTGELDYDKRGEKEFFTIRATQLKPLARAHGDEPAAADTTTKRQPGAPRRTPGK